MADRTRPDALLTPKRGVLLLIDHQAVQFTKPHRLNPSQMINHVVGRERAAKAPDVPTIVTTAIENPGGFLRKSYAGCVPGQTPEPA